MIWLVVFGSLSVRAAVLWVLFGVRFGLFCRTLVGGGGRDDCGFDIWV